MNDLEQRQKAMKLQLRVKRGGRQRTVENPMTVDALMYKMRNKLIERFQSICYFIGKIELMKRLPENATWPDLFKVLDDYISEMERQKA